MQSAIGKIDAGAGLRGKRVNMGVSVASSENGGKECPQEYKPKEKDLLPSWKLESFFHMVTFECVNNSNEQ